MRSPLLHRKRNQSRSEYAWKVAIFQGVPSLRFNHESGVEMSYELPREEDVPALYIGRWGGGRNVMRIFDNSISKFQACFKCERGDWLIQDVGAADVPHVNGQYIDETQKLSDGDRIRLGPIEFTFRA